VDAARRRLADCDKQVTRYRAALDSGADPAVVSPWIAEVQAEHLAAEVERDRSTSHGRKRMSRDQLAALMNGLGNLLDVLANAAPEDKAEVYARLRLRLRYDPTRRLVITESDPWAKVSVGEPIGPTRPPDAAGASVANSQSVSQSVRACVGCAANAAASTHVGRVVEAPQVNGASLHIVSALPQPPGAAETSGRAP